MKDLLISRNLEQALEPDVPMDVKPEDWNNKQRKVCSIIRLHLSPKIQMKVLDFLFADEIWAYLNKRYLDRSSSSKMLAKAKLYSCKMKEGEDLGQHVQNWTSILCESVALGDKPMEDKDKAFLLLNSLPSSLDHLTQTMLYGKDKLSFDDMHNLLLT